MDKEYQNLSFGSIREPRMVQEDSFRGKAILSLDIAPEKRGGSSRLLLNKAAQELFNMTDNEEYPITALFAKDNSGNYDVFLLSVEGVAFDERTLYLLRKNKSISSKIFYKELKEVFKIEDVTKQNHLELTENTEIVEYINNNIREQGQEGRVLKAASIKLYVEPREEGMENATELQELQEIVREETLNRESNF